jgi:hypothetical protein
MKFPPTPEVLGFRVWSHGRSRDRPYRMPMPRVLTESNWARSGGRQIEDIAVMIQLVDLLFDRVRVVGRT